MRSLLVVMALLVTWKVVRTDWIVICPWYEGNNDIISVNSGYIDATLRPLVSPAWRPPNAETSGILDLGSGNSFPVGSPRVRPHWELIGLKIGFPVLLLGLVHSIRHLVKRRSMVIALVRELLEESKMQNKPRVASGDKALDSLRSSGSTTPQPPL